MVFLWVSNIHCWVYQTIVVQDTNHISQSTHNTHNQVEDATVTEYIWVRVVQE